MQDSSSLYAWVWGSGIVVCLAVWLYGLNIQNRWRLRSLPGPRWKWLVGQLKEAGTGRLHEHLLQWAQQYGPIFKFHFGRVPVVVVTNPELAYQVCVKRFMNFHDRPPPIMQLYSGRHRSLQMSSMLFARGKLWAGLRAAGEPLFHTKPLHRYAPLMNSAAEGLVHVLEKSSTPEQAPKAVNINQTLSNMTMEVLGTAALGVHLDAQSTEGEHGQGADLVWSGRQLFTVSNVKPILKLLLMAIPLLSGFWRQVIAWFKDPGMLDAAVARGYLWGASQALLDNARRKRPGFAGIKPTSTANGVAAAAADGGPGLAEPVHAAATANAVIAELANARKHPSGIGANAQIWGLMQGAFAKGEANYQGMVPQDTSILYHLMNATNKETGERLTDQQICSTCTLFILAGYETTSTALAYALYEISRNLDVEARILQEVDAFGRNKAPDYEDLARFPYLWAAFHESMRLWTVATPIIAMTRMCTQACTLAGHYIPKGTRVMVNTWGMQRDPKLYPDPEEFRPERFLEGSKEAQSRHPYAYMPFGAGPHKCIGYKFAEEEAMLTLVRLYQHFTFTVAPETGDLRASLLAAVTVYPKHGIFLRPHARV